MDKLRDMDMFARELYLAGERVLPGHYEQVGSSRFVDLDLEGFLPQVWMGRSPALCACIGSGGRLSGPALSIQPDELSELSRPR